MSKRDDEQEAAMARAVLGALAVVVVIAVVGCVASLVLP